MKRVISLIALLALLSLAAFAKSTQDNTWNALGMLRNAKYVYVTSYDGPQFSTNLLPEDRDAISAVQNALQDSGYIVVYRPSEADMIVAVQARPSSDLLVVYQGGRFRTGSYLWRAEAKNGLSGSNPPLVRELERAMETAGATS
jgi:hypothetical protein